MRGGACRRHVDVAPLARARRYSAAIGGHHRELECDRVEGLRAHYLVSPVPGEDDPASALEPVDLQGPRERIE